MKAATVRAGCRAGLALVVCVAQPAAASSIVTEWLDESVPAANETAWEPTVAARFFALVHGAMYDAWTAYDPVAVGVFCGAALHGMGGAATVANKREALSHAAYEVLRELAPVRRRALAERMSMLGYDTDASSAPARVGHLAAQAVLAAARQDGANQVADYRDTTGYRFASPPTPSSWQPIEALGAPQLPVSPHWSRVATFALRRADELRPPPPPMPGSVAWNAQVRDLLEITANLTDEHKAIAEFWIPWGAAPAAHMMELTKYLAARDDLRIDDEIKLFFLVSIALHDTAVAVWEAKYHYDYLRPITAIQALGDVPVRGWAAPQLPVAFAYSAPATRGALAPVAPQRDAAVEMPARQWQPYLPTPPFPAYVSGHSAFTAAWARIAELATGRPDFGLRVVVRRLYTEQRLLDQPIELAFPTFWSAAESSGRSRLYGGIHWPVDHVQGLALGKAAAERVWQRGQQFFLGTASPFAAALSNLTSVYWHVQALADGASPRAPGRLETELTPDARIVWQSIPLDSPPAGSYQVRISAVLKGSSGASIRARIRSAVDPKLVLGTSDLRLVPSQPQLLDLDWQSDGSTPCQIEVELSAGGSKGLVALTRIESSRRWPLVQGVPRYRAMTDVILSSSIAPAQ